jgi:lysophospholipid hydrolase
MIASRVRDEVDSSSLGQTRKPGSELGHNNTNLKTVAVLPVSRNVPIEAFARKLQTALEGMGASTSYLNQAIITNHLGRHAFTRMGKLKVRIGPDASHCNVHFLLLNAYSPQDGSLTRSKGFIQFSTLWIRL